MRELVEEYPKAAPEWRQGARTLFRRFESFAWAAPMPYEIETPEGFCAHLVLFSLIDQGKDPRDARLWIQDLCRTARDAGMAVNDALREAANWSSDEDPYQWGSTRRWLEDAIE